MSYFDDHIEPSLFRDPPVPQSERLVPTDKRDILWRTKDGRVIKIGDMEIRHLQNAHSLVGRRIGTHDERQLDLILYGVLRAEINRRERNRDD